MKRINPNTQVLVSAEYEESKKANLYEYGVDEIVLIPLIPKE
jgi:hypothetical protein